LTTPPRNSSLIIFFGLPSAVQHGEEKNQINPIFFVTDPIFSFDLISKRTLYSFLSRRIVSGMAGRRTTPCGVRATGVALASVLR
jgi:hypothetical protein